MIKRNKYVDESVENNTERYRASKSMVIEFANMKVTT